MESQTGSTRPSEVETLAVLGLIHDTVKQVDCIGYLAMRLSEGAPSRTTSTRSDAQAIRHLTQEITQRLRRFLDSSITPEKGNDHYTSVREILAHACHLIAIAHPTAIIESTTSDSAASTPLPRATADLLIPLLDNAITHGASPRPTRLVTALAADRLSITVADSGPGMPPGTLAACQQLGFTTGVRNHHCPRT